MQLANVLLRSVVAVCFALNDHIEWRAGADVGAGAEF